MNKYPILKNILPTYSVSVGLSEEVENDLLRNSHHGEALLAIKNELISILSDREISLVAFLEEDCCEAYIADSEDDARDFIVERIWNILFPDQPRYLGS